MTDSSGAEIRPTCPGLAFAGPAEPDGSSKNPQTPASMADEKRYTPSVSLTKSQKEILQEKAEKAGVSYTRYMREVALGVLPQEEADFSKYDQVEVLLGLKNEINRK